MQHCVVMGKMWCVTGFVSEGCRKRGKRKKAGFAVFSQGILGSFTCPFCNRIYSSLTALHCFDSGYVGKQPVTWKEYCMENWLKEVQESMDICTGCCYI